MTRLYVLEYGKVKVCLYSSQGVEEFCCWKKKGCLGMEQLYGGTAKLSEIRKKEKTRSGDLL